MVQEMIYLYDSQLIVKKLPVSKLPRLCSSAAPIALAKAIAGALA